MLFNSGEFSGPDYEAGFNAIADKLAAMGVGERKVNYRLRDWGGFPPALLGRANSDGDHGRRYRDADAGRPTAGYPAGRRRHGRHHQPDQKPILSGRKPPLTACRRCVKPTPLTPLWSPPRYYARYTCPQYDKGMLDPNAANYWLPVDIYIGGIEHAIMHLLYFRFFHKLMRDAGMVNSDEPAKQLLCRGYGTGRCVLLRRRKRRA